MTTRSMSSVITQSIMKDVWYSGVPCDDLEHSSDLECNVVLDFGICTHSVLELENSVAKIVRIMILM